MTSLPSLMRSRSRYATGQSIDRVPLHVHCALPDRDGTFLIMLCSSLLQVELMNTQLMRCKKRTDTQDIELFMDLMVIVQNTDDDRNADRAILERLAKKLELQTLAELRAETMAIKKLINERNGQFEDSTKQIIELLNKFKHIAGVDEMNVLGDVSMPKTLGKCPSLMIPNDFLCPITLEIMTDPVIIASGQVRHLLVGTHP
jgi:hypothetical protein